MKIVEGEGKKTSEILGGPEGSGGGRRRSRERGSGGGRVGSQGERPTPHRHTTTNPPQHRTDTPQHNTTQHTTPHHNTTTTTTRDPAQGGLGQGVPRREVHGPKKTRHEQQILEEQAKVFLGSRMVRKGLGTKRFDQKKGPRGGGQKWCGSKVVRADSGQEKTKKNMEKTKKNSPFHPKQKIKVKKKSTKNGKISLLSPPRPKNQENQKNQQQNQKIEKMLKERKSNQNIAQTRFFFFQKFFEKKTENACFFFKKKCDVLGFWSTKNLCFPKKGFCIPKKRILFQKKKFFVSVVSQTKRFVPPKKWHL